jgi:hypothetical protein
MCFGELDPAKTSKPGHVEINRSGRRLALPRAVNGVTKVVRHPASPVDGWSSASPVLDFVNAEGLFASLDGRDLSASGQQWRIEVFGIADADHDRWIQLAVSGSERYLITLRLHAGDGAQRAVAALTGWLANPVDDALLSA